MQHYPHAKLLRLDAFAAVAAWVFGLLAILMQLVEWLIPSADSSLGMAAIGAFFVAAVAHVVLALFHRCPACGKHPTIQGISPVHPASVPQSRLSGWSGAVWNVFRRKEIVCIHCGSEFRAQ